MWKRYGNRVANVGFTRAHPGLASLLIPRLSLSSLGRAGVLGPAGWGAGVTAVCLQ